MMNERIAHGSLDELRRALVILADSHTRDHQEIGFTVEIMCTPQHEHNEYVDAWRIVRRALGYHV